SSKKRKRCTAQQVVRHTFWPENTPCNAIMHAAMSVNRFRRSAKHGENWHLSWRKKLHFTTELDHCVRICRGLINRTNPIFGAACLTTATPKGRGCSNAQVCRSIALPRYHRLSEVHHHRRQSGHG